MFINKDQVVKKMSRNSYRFIKKTNFAALGKDRHQR